ncbi:MAG: glycoside hydrolase family 92 protein, partial [Prevotella sp.]|nr:glycoside hydrolase family 92 protein [Prevotella sp.]
MRNKLLLLIMLCFVLSHVRAQHWQYVDPRIGSEGVGRTFPGPSMPFGMVKPGPDCGVSPNAGWAPIPKSVLGFSQTHVSGTGGGQKYGNVLIQPMIDNEQEQRRVSEDISLGYYATTYENGIRTEITTSERCALYRFHYPRRGSLFIDATHFLGKNPIPDLREAQQFVGAELEVVNNHEVCGYTRIRGGWNNGDAYTVYFVLRSDVPFSATADNLSQRVWLQLADTIATIRVGVSFVSTMQARRNIIDTPFDEQIENVRMKWERLLCRVDLQQATECDKRMFYTALYHTMLMPVDRTGENPKWTDTPYFDDYYAIWDTYRTSSPLITLIAPDRQRDIIHSLLNIYRREGYLPDARSGDCNGRTQGGSNAEVVIADAYVKHLEGIDYELALEAMLKDATMPPGGNEEKEGRGGLQEYNTLGYIPYGIPRAGNRTVEYAFNDYCIAQVAQGLGDELTAQHYMVQSQR